MREYGKIKTSFWGNPKVRSVSEPARYLLAYLFACPHGNALGCFVLPLGYVSEDLGWASERVDERLRELIGKGFIERDEDLKMIRIASWWEHNVIENPNVARSIVRAVRALPKSRLVPLAISDLLRLDFGFPEAVSKHFAEAFREPFRNKEPEPEPQPEPEPEPEGRGAAIAPPPPSIEAGPEPEAVAEQTTSSEKPSTSTRGTRLPAGWLLSNENLEFARSLNLGVGDASMEADKFRDYWRAQPGSRGVKLDWDGTWRNWIRKAIEDGRKYPGSRGVQQAVGADPGQDALRAGLAAAAASRLGPSGPDAAAGDPRDCEAGFG